MLIEAREEEVKRREEEQERQDIMKVSKRFTLEDKESVFEKLRSAALQYDRNHPSSVQLTAFEGLDMEPHDFKVSLLLGFH